MLVTPSDFILLKITFVLLSLAPTLQHRSADLQNVDAESDVTDDGGRRRNVAVAVDVDGAAADHPLQVRTIEPRRFLGGC